MPFEELVVARARLPTTLTGKEAASSWQYGDSPFGPGEMFKVEPHEVTTIMTPINTQDIAVGPPY